MPVRAVALVVVLIVLLSLLNNGTGTYVAFSVITSLTSLASYLSYLIALSCVLYVRFTRGIDLGSCDWGRAGLSINIVAVLYTGYAAEFMPFPNYLPVTASNMNYRGPVMEVVLLFIIASWFLKAKKNWKALTQLSWHLCSNKINRGAAMAWRRTCFAQLRALETSREKSDKGE